MLVANPGVSVITAEVRIAGVLQASYAIPPGSAVTPTYPGKTDGPVTISANGAFLASERTLQRDNFEEIMALQIR